ncbi:MAG: DUF3618 domain-containing protein [Gemmatimonadaceae bacterium]
MTVDNSADFPTSARTAATRAEIAATRERMGDTLEELSARLSPGRLKQQAKDTVRDATIGRVQTMAQGTVDKATSAGRKVADVVRENPIPAALIAAGISWLAWSARRGGSSASSTSYYEKYENEESSYKNEDSSASYQNRQASSSIQGADGDAGFDVTESGGPAGKVRDKASEAVETTQEAAQRAKAAAADLKENVARTARAQSDKIAGTFEQNPLPIGVVAAALGLAAGFVLPSTRKEAELVGEKRDELVDKAREAIREKKEKAQNVAKRVVSEAKSVATQAAREEGLTS